MLGHMVITEKESALSNLLAAYEGEINANARYKAFAQKAETEGLPKAASLFRAAARAEQIHAGNHARVIRRMGGHARAEIRPFHVKNTLENLRAALFGEQREIDSLYPAFLEHAQSNWDVTAARTFTWAMEAEKSHAKLYSDAVRAFENGGITHWTLGDLAHYVCTVCGYTATNHEADNCPVCNFLWERFEVIR
jgi:rubrerythrin